MKEALKTIGALIVFVLIAAITVAVSVIIFSLAFFLIQLLISFLNDLASNSDGASFIFGIIIAIFCGSFSNFIITCLWFILPTCAVCAVFILIAHDSWVAKLAMFVAGLMSIIAGIVVISIGDYTVGRSIGIMIGAAFGAMSGFGALRSE